MSGAAVDRFSLTASSPMSRIDSSGTGYERLLEDLAAWIKEERNFPLVKRAQEQFLKDIETIRKKRERLLAPLNIVLAGGTGVGKSSLLNALAGTEITEASETRAFTRDYTCYYHDDDHMALKREVLAGGKSVAHSREELRDKIIVDAPDFDSAELNHRDKLVAALKSADLVIWVTTCQKYADLSGIKTLSEFREGRGFVFVLNRDDQEVSDAVVDDLRRMLQSEGFEKPRIFRVSALGALCQKQGLDTVAGGRDDEALEHFIEQELDHKRIRILKRGNLAALVIRLIARLQERIPSGLRGLLETWRKQGDEHYDDLRLGVRRRVTDTLHTNRAFVRQLRYRFASTYRGLFGGWMQFIYAMRAISDLDYPDLFSRRQELGAVPRIRRGDDGLASDTHEVLDLHRRIETSGRNLGLTSEVTRTQPSESEIERSLRRFYDRVDAGFLHELDEVTLNASESRTARALQLILNSLPVGWLLFAITLWLDLHFHILHLVNDKATVGEGYFTAVLFVCLFIMLICQKLAERQISGHVNTVLEMADQIVTHSVDTTIRVDVLKARDKRIDSALEELDALEELERRAQSLQRSGY
jgi:energy-coupling factor transporter ATP-binding protein EcfA2